MSLQSIPSEREPLADGGSACDVTYALRRRGCQLAKHVAEPRATKLAVAVATGDLRSAREGGRHAFAYAPDEIEATLSSAISRG